VVLAEAARFASALHAKPAPASPQNDREQILAPVVRVAVAKMVVEASATQLLIAGRARILEAGAAKRLLALRAANGAHFSTGLAVPSPAAAAREADGAARRAEFDIAVCGLALGVLALAKQQEVAIQAPRKRVPAALS
jgi:hypothetical protein